jgi:cell division protein FtsA
MMELVESDDFIEVPSVGERPARRVSRQDLAQVVEARYEELFNLVRAELRRSGFEDLIAAGIVLTGGASNIRGVLDLAEKVFRMPVRQGIPQHVNGLKDVINNPVYATGVGLLLHGLKQQAPNAQHISMDTGMKGIWGRMKDWFQGNF